MVASICVVVPFDIFSIKSGSSERVKSDLKALLDTGYNIELFLPLKDLHNDNFMMSPKLNIHSYKNIQSFEFLPEKVRLLFDMYTQPINPFFRTKLKKSFQKYDIIFAHFLYGPLASISITQNKVPILYVSHGFEYGLIKQVTSIKFLHAIIRYMEKYICEKSDLILCVSKADKKSLLSEYDLDNDKLIVVPNTINTNFFQNSPYEKITERKNLDIGAETFVAVFHGRMDYRPNLEALDFIQMKLLPYIEKMNFNILILVVGAKVPQNILKLKSNKLLAFSDVPDIRKYLSVADVSIVPLSSGGGSRIKILECFASKIPVVSTKKGAEGIEYSNNQHLIISELSPVNFVESMLQVRNNSILRDALIQNGYDLVIKNYSFKSITGLMDTAIEKYAHIQKSKNISGSIDFKISK